MQSNLSFLAGNLLSLLEGIVQSGIDIQSIISEIVLVNTHLNEYSHIEQLEWHPELQGVWSTSSHSLAAKDDSILDKSSSAGSLGPSNLGYFDAIARRLGVVLQQRMRIIVKHICLSSIWLTNNVFALNYNLDLFPDISVNNPRHFSHNGADSPAPSPTVSIPIQDFASVLSSFLDNVNIKDTLYAIGAY